MSPPSQSIETQAFLERRKVAMQRPPLPVAQHQVTLPSAQFEQQQLKNLPPITDCSPHLKPQLLIQGMHGLGDNIHQRGLIRQLMLRYNVTLQSSWFSLYYDLIERGLHIVSKPTHLRTQSENANREAHLFHQPQMMRNPSVVRMWYRPQTIREQGSVLAAMCSTVGPACDKSTIDFRYHEGIPTAWLNAIDARIASWKLEKPIVFYRPLTDRSEWSGCKARNPDFKAYYDLIMAIRDQFSVVSIAHLTSGSGGRVPTGEWMVGNPITPDVMLHRGELAFEEMIALMVRSSLCFCSPGNAIVMAQSVNTPVVCVFGGYENSSSFSLGAKYSPTLGIDPITPCSSFTHTTWDKRIDMPKSLARLRQFVEMYAHAPHRTASVA